jgi:hypothetical protein
MKSCSTSSLADHTFLMEISGIKVISVIHVTHKILHSSHFWTSFHISSLDFVASILLYTPPGHSNISMYLQQSEMESQRSL